MLPGNSSSLLPSSAPHLDHFHARQRAFLFVRLARDQRPALLERNVPGRNAITIRTHAPRKIAQMVMPEGRQSFPGVPVSVRRARAFQFLELPPELLILLAQPLFLVSGRIWADRVRHRIGSRRLLFHFFQSAFMIHRRLRRAGNCKRSGPRTAS